MDEHSDGEAASLPAPVPAPLLFRKPLSLKRAIKPGPASSCRRSFCARVSRPQTHSRAH